MECSIGLKCSIFDLIRLRKILLYTEHIKTGTSYYIKIHPQNTAVLLYGNSKASINISIINSIL